MRLLVLRQLKRSRTLASFVKCSGGKHHLSCPDDKSTNCNCDFCRPKDSQHCDLLPLKRGCQKKYNYDDRNKKQVVRSNPPNQLRVSDFHRQRRQTKNCAVCSFLFFYALSLSSEVIVGDYNKSDSAVHLSHTQALAFLAPTLPSSLCLPPSLSLLHFDTRMAAGLPPSRL